MIRGHKVTGTKIDGADVLAEDLVAINRLTLRPHQADELFVFSAMVAGNQVDRDGERFSAPLLGDFAKTLVGRSLLVGHDWSGLGVGRWFKSWLHDAGSRLELRGKAYLLRQTDGDLIAKIEGGVAAFVSIGFFAPMRSPVTLPDGTTVMEYDQGPNGERGEAIEASLVFLGAQYDAAVTKAAAGEGRRDTCGRPESVCEVEAAVLRAELMAVKQLQAQARYWWKSGEQHPEVSLVELDNRRVALIEKLATSCKGRI